MPFFTKGLIGWLYLLYKNEFFKLTLATGMRVSEVINLKTKDIQIDDENDIIVINIESNK